MMKRNWEIDPSQPDPYAVVEKGKVVIHTAPSLLTLGSHSFKRQFCEAKACRD